MLYMMPEEVMRPKVRRICGWSVEVWPKRGNLCIGGAAVRPLRNADDDE